MPRISALTALTSADGGDTVPILDVSATTTKKITKMAFLSDIVDGTLLGDNSIQSRHIDWADTGGGDNGGIWWEELGRTTLGGTADTISVAGFAARKHLTVIITLLASTSINSAVTFNGDTANNYSRRFSTDGGADTSEVSQAGLLAHIGTPSTPQFSVHEIINVAANEKLVLSKIVSQGTAGAGNATSRREVSGKWANTVAQITTVTVTNVGAGDYASGSSVVVLGHD